MMKQEILAGIILCAIGLGLLFVSPNALWAATEKWKTKGGAPSRSYAVVIKVIGGVFAAVGGILIICSL